MNKDLLTLLQEVEDFTGMDIQHFDLNTNVTSDSGLSTEMKTMYDDYLIENAKVKLVHDQFGQARDIPANNGKTIEFRKYAPYPKALTPLTEGVTPSGRKLSVSAITATVDQYGDYTTLSDMLIMTAWDNNIGEATKLHADQAGRTLDTITREVLNGGTNVQYADSQVAARHLLVGGSATAANNHYMTVGVVRRAVRDLKIGLARAVAGGDFVAIIHPDSAYDLLGDSAWLEAHKYSKPEEIFEGEIGKVHGCRFVETTEAKIFHAADLVVAGSTNAARNLTVASLSGKTFTMQAAIATAEAAALVGRKVIVKGYYYTVTASAAGSAGAATITVAEAVTGSPGNNEVMYPGEGGAAGRDVYSTLFLGADAYGTTKVSGGGLQTIVHQVGSAGSADALNQRATVGWKAIKTALILVQDFMVRVETASTFEAGAN